MQELNHLYAALSHFTNFSKEAFDISAPYWQIKEYKKGDVFNARQMVCKHMGFVVKGVFRSYIIDERTGEDKKCIPVFREWVCCNL